MTLAQLATVVCLKIGQRDAESIAAAKEFAKTRAQMIFDSHVWRDSLGLVAATANTTGVMALPAGIDRPIALRAHGDHNLVPTDSAYVMQIDPYAFEEIGSPLAFEEFTDTGNNNARMVRFFPLPSESTAILVFGKLSMPPLVNDADVPILRNIDNAWIAYVTGDMLERQRQYAKAQLKFTEAGSLLDLLRRLETEQAARVQRVVPEQLEPDWGTSWDWNWPKFISSGSGSGGGGTDIFTTMISDVLPLISGQPFIDVVFPTPFISSLWRLVSLSIENVTDADPAAIGWETITQRSVTGFRVLFTAAPDTGNYTLHWGVLPPA